MSTNALTLLIGWLLALAIFFSFIVLLRYLEHRERMALIARGLTPDEQKGQRSKSLLRAGLITMMVGLTLTIGLYPLGFILPPAFTSAPFHLGPWLLPGLIPCGVGLALTISYYLEHSVSSSSPGREIEEKEDGKIIPLAKRREERSEGEGR
ncbi:MAG: hypothetical protein IMW89_18965 [Ktedonobacteraceae bacterium]|nr:hypothetical protein [Ktedonobacteraceae bacterium]